jgi:Mor family transcriptional regulator
MPLNDEQFDLDSLNAKQLNQLTQKWPKNLAELVSIVDNRLAKEKLDKPLLAEKLITDISIYLGGRDIYLPRGRSLSGFLRNLRIYQAFNGRNADELAKEHGLSRGYCGGMI